MDANSGGIMRLPAIEDYAEVVRWQMLNIFCPISAAPLIVPDPTTSRARELVQESASPALTARWRKKGDEFWRHFEVSCK